MCFTNVKKWIGHSDYGNILHKYLRNGNGIGFFCNIFFEEWLQTITDIMVSIFFEILNNTTEWSKINTFAHNQIRLYFLQFMTH